MEELLVSVVIPVWNDEKHLQRCLDSVCSQTWPALDIIVVDDGSGDDSALIAEKAMEKDSRVRVIRRENGGVAAARNTALPLCRGRYVRFVDSDDRLPPDSIRHLVETAEINRSDLVIGAYTEVIGTLYNPRSIGLGDETVNNARILQVLSRWSNTFYYGVLWNKLFRRDLIEKGRVNFTSGLAWGEDFMFVVQYLVNAERITFTKKSVYEYIRNPRGLTFSQLGGSLIHPVRSTGMKYKLYKAYRQLYIARGAYPEYKRVLWLYMLRTTLTK